VFAISSFEWNKMPGDGTKRKDEGCQEREILGLGEE